MKAPVVATLILSLAASSMGAGAALGDEVAVKGSAKAIWGERHRISGLMNTRGSRLVGV